MKTLDEGEVEEFARFVNRTRVPLSYAGLVSVRFPDQPHPEQLAVVQLDARHRPDVADLVRIVRSEGAPRIEHAPPRYSMEKGRECMVVALVLRDPVRCELSFIVPWEPCQDFFALIVRQGFFYLTAAEIDQALFQHAFRVRVSTEELAAVLAEWQAG